MSTTPTTPTAEQLLSLQSDANNFRLIQYTPEYYGGINKEIQGRSVVIVFPEDKNLIEFKGDQGTTKSSQLACLQALLGGDEIPNAINQQSQQKKATLTFVRNGNTFIVRLNKSGFTLTNVINTGDGKPVNQEVKEPKTVLKQLIGPLGQDPMFLKGMDGLAQVKYIRNMFHLTDEQATMESLINDSIKKSYEERKEANREEKRLKNAISETEFFEWDGKKKTFIPSETYGTAENKFEKDSKEREIEINERYRKAQEDMRAFNDKSTQIGFQKRELQREDLEIDDLEKKLAEIQKKLSDKKTQKLILKENIENIEAYLRENESNFRIELDAASAEFNAQSDYKVDYQNFQNAKKEFDQYKVAAEMATNMQNKYAELLKSKVKFIQLITPKIEGLEVCIPNDVDIVYETDVFKQANPQATPKELEDHVAKLKSETREGIYYHGRSVIQLSESELFSLWILLCKELKVKVAFIENITSLGTGAIESINAFTAEGGVVFLSAMERTTKELKISFYNTLS